MYHPFSVPETLKTAWYLVRKNFSIIAIYSLISFIIVIVVATLIYFFFRDHSNLAFSISVIILLIMISYIVTAFIKLIFQLIDKEYYDFEFVDIVPQAKMVFAYLILFTVIFTMFFVLSKGIKSLEDGLIQYVLGILIGGFFQFFLIFYFPVCVCFIVDDSSGPFESVIQAFQLIRGNFLKYLLLFGIIELLVFAGIFTVIGMVIAVPLSYIILVVAYRKLIYSHQDVDDDPIELN